MKCKGCWCGSKSCAHNFHLSSSVGNTKYTLLSCSAATQTSTASLFGIAHYNILLFKAFSSFARLFLHKHHTQTQSTQKFITNVPAQTISKERNTANCKQTQALCRTKATAQGKETGWGHLSSQQLHGKEQSSLVYRYPVAGRARKAVL